MPLSRLLQEAFFSKDGVTNFYQYLEKLAGFSETPLRTNAYKAVEEMSKIRHQTRVDHVRKTGLDESPTYRISPIQMKGTEHWSFIPKHKVHKVSIYECSLMHTFATMRHSLLKGWPAVRQLGQVMGPAQTSH